MPNDPALPMRQQIIELETQLAHQQRVCEQLNEVVTEHTQQLMRIERTLARIESQMREFRDRPKEATDLHDEKPPHY